MLELRSVALSSSILLLVGCPGDGPGVDVSTSTADTGEPGTTGASTGDEPTGGDSSSASDDSGEGGDVSGSGGEDSGSMPEPLDPPVTAIGPRTVGTDGALSCAIRGASGPGSVACWGQYQSVVGSIPAAIGAEPETVVGVTDAVDLAVGSDHVCAVRAGGAVVCWGFNHHSQLGLPEDGVFHPEAVEIAGIDDAVQVTVGSSHSCALRVDGGVACWGMGGWGQLGSGDPEDLADSPAPVQVAGVEHAVKVVAGGGHTCALLADRRVMCWGFNAFGEVGTGTSGDFPPASVVQGVGPARDVALNNHGTWVLGEDGTIWYMGTHSSPETILIPEVEQVVAGAVRIDGTTDRACVTDAFGAVSCWAYRAREPWGTGEPNRASNQLVAESGAPPLRELGVTRLHACGRDGSGEVLCWGQGAWGQLGPATAGKAEVLATAPLLHDATHVAASYDGSCTTVAGNVWCWGQNTGGRLGVGLADSVLPQVLDDVDLDPDVRDLAVGEDFSCAAAGGQVTCWGSNEAGQLGAVTPQPTATVQVPGIEQIDRVVIGGKHACALQTGGAVACWGENLLGQLGRGEFSTSEGPGWVALPAAAVDVAAGANHTCVALANQEAWCWGLGKEGQLGVSVLPDVDLIGDDPKNYLRMYVKLAPQKLSLTDVVRVAASGAATCVAHSTGVSCHGQGYSGAQAESAVAGGDLSATRLLLSGWGGCRLGNTGAACHGSFKALGAGEPGDVLEGAGALALAGHACVVEANGDVRCYSDTDLEVLAGTLDSAAVAVVVEL